LAKRQFCSIAERAQGDGSESFAGISIHAPGEREALLGLDRLEHCFPSYRSPGLVLLLEFKVDIEAVEARHPKAFVEIDPIRRTLEHPWIEAAAAMFSVPLIRYEKRGFEHLQVP
jgi:hypothetical protein